jgi:hypothetical protein
MAGIILSVLLAVAVQAPVQKNPRTTGADVSQYREIVEAYRNGRNMEAIREVEALPQGGTVRRSQGHGGCPSS